MTGALTIIPPGHPLRGRASPPGSKSITNRALLLAALAPALTPTYLGGLAYLAAVGSVLGFLAYLHLAARVGPERAAYATVTAPLVALAVSTGLEGYAWSAWAVLACRLSCWATSPCSRPCPACWPGPKQDERELGRMFDVEKHLADSAAAAGFTQQGAVEVARFIGALTRLAGPRRALELGTGMGLTTYHILSNLPSDGVLDSVESDHALIEVARRAIGGDKRLRLHNRLGEDFIGEALKSEGYDLVFADTWPGKYFLLDEVLRMVKPGGLYVIDDMNRSDGWPGGHAEKARSLLAHLQGLEGWSFSYYTFGTGVGMGQRHSAQRPA